MATEAVADDTGEAHDANEPENVHNTSYTEMSAEIDGLLLRQKQEIIAEIVSYMKFGAADDEEDEEFDPDFDAGYEQSHVDRCDAILTRFLASMCEHRHADAAVLLDDVKSTVEALNTLNKECGGGMFETDQRESICTLIDDGLRHAGFEVGGDVTEPWREW